VLVAIISEENESEIVGKIKGRIEGEEVSELAQEMADLIDIPRVKQIFEISKKEEDLEDGFLAAVYNKVALKQI